jgi:uncharacterized membrane protein
MNPIIAPDNTWPIWALVLAGTALCIHLEQTRKWAAQVSGPVLALLFGMALSSFKLMPVSSPSYDVIEDYLVPAAIPLLLFRANLVRILRETGPMFLAFHVAAAGTVIGAFLAAFLFRGSFDRVPEVTGIMTGSYLGGGVNFVAIKDSYQVSENLTNPLLVADNFIMAGMFAALLVMAGSKFFRRFYRHPHSVQGDKEDVVALAARHWRRKEVSLLDIAQALAIASTVAAISITYTGALKAQVSSRIVQSVFANPFVLITFLSVGITTLFHRWTDRIQGAEDLGMYLLYLFFFVIGLKADLVAVVSKVPILFAFCLVMAVTNLVFTLAGGKLLSLNLEELLLGVNATLGGAPSAAAMAISRGWSNLVLPGLLAGIWGYVIGTFVGILVTETLLKLFSAG